ncbi:MAG TPA: hypothetical protein QF874_01295 [Pelagibacteraceae bacterium]|nr:hypothetical protein [Pelagibacteraceae bacterium]
MLNSEKRMNKNKNFFISSNLNKKYEYFLVLTVKYLGGNMRIKAMIIVLFLLLPNVTLAEIKYNPFTGQWERAPRNPELKYNPYDGDWSYERKDSELEYNPWTGKWDFEK